MRYVPVEEARKRLGKLVREASSGEPVIIGRRGADQVILLSQEEYERLRLVEERAAQARFRGALEAISATVRDQKLAQKTVDEAIRAARRR
jgi:prevent-host-death family protein